MIIKKELLDGLRNLSKRDVDTFPAKVLSVDKENGLCKIEFDNVEISGVQLSTTIKKNAKGFFLYPKIGSYVLVSPIMEDMNRLYVEFFSEIEDFDLNIGNTQLQINDEGFLLKKENETLKKLMGDFIQACRNMKFQTNTGVTIKLLTDFEFEQLKTRFNQFLK